MLVLVLVLVLVLLLLRFALLLVRTQQWISVGLGKAGRGQHQQQGGCSHHDSPPPPSPPRRRTSSCSPLLSSRLVSDSLLFSSSPSIPQLHTFPLLAKFKTETRMPNFSLLSLSNLEIPSCAGYTPGVMSPCCSLRIGMSLQSSLYYTLQPALDCCSNSANNPYPALSGFNGLETADTAPVPQAEHAESEAHTSLNASLAHKHKKITSCRA